MQLVVSSEQKQKHRPIRQLRDEHPAYWRAYIANVFKLWICGSISIRHVLYALRERPIAIATPNNAFIVCPQYDDDMFHDDVGKRSRRLQ